VQGGKRIVARLEAAQCCQTCPPTAGAGGPPVEGDYDEGYGGGVEDERRADSSAALARAKTAVDHLDDDIPF
jgi:hypothetical protein